MIPFSPHLNYYNTFKLNNSISNQNEIDFRIIKRNKSQVSTPSENNTLKINNYFTSNKKINDLNIYNKLSLFNNISDYSFEHDGELNGEERYHHLILSSDFYLKLNNNINPRFKLIHNQDIYHTDNIINEDSNLTFNYQNQYSDNDLEQIIEIIRLD